MLLLFICQVSHKLLVVDYILTKHNSNQYSYKYVHMQKNTIVTINNPKTWLYYLWKMNIACSQKKFKSYLKFRCCLESPESSYMNEEFNKRLRSRICVCVWERQREQERDPILLIVLMQKHVQLTFKSIEHNGESWFPWTCSFSSWDLSLKLKKE